MKFVFHHIIFLFLFTLFVTCLSNNESDNQTLTIDLEKAIDDNRSIDLKSIVSKVEYVALETNDSIVIGYSKAFVTNKYILILSIGNSSNMYLFDRKGKFIRRIGKMGQGPGEYGNIGSISIDENSESIYISTDSKRNIIKYGFDGTFSKFIDIGKSSSFIYHNSIIYSHIPSMFFKTGGKDIFQLSAYSPDGKIINKYHPVDYSRNKYREMFIETPNFSVSNNTLYYYLSREDIVYEVRKDSLLEFLKINLGKYAYNPDYKWDYNGYYKSRTLDKVWIEKTFITKSYVLFVLSQKGVKRIVVYDKNKKTAYNTLENTLDHIPLNYVKYICNNKINTVLLASDLIDKQNFKNTPKELKNILKTLKSDNNPVVRIITLKQ